MTHRSGMETWRTDLATVKRILSDMEVKTGENNKKKQKNNNEVSGMEKFVQNLRKGQELESNKWFGYFFINR